DDHNLHRLRRHRTNLLHQPVVVGFAGQLGIYEDDTLVGDAHERIRAATGHEIESRFEHLNRLNGLAATASAAATLRGWLLLSVDNKNGRDQRDRREEEPRHVIRLRPTV